MTQINIAICLVSAVVSSILVTSCFPFRLYREENAYFLPIGVIVTLMNIAGTLSAVAEHRHIGQDSLFYSMMPIVMNFCLFAVLSLFPFYITKLCGTGERKDVRLLRNASVPVSAAALVCYCVHAFTVDASDLSVLILPGTLGDTIWYSISHVACFMIFILCLFIVIFSARRLFRHQTAALIIFMVFPVIASLLTRYNENLLLLPSAMMLSLLTIHNYIQLDRVLRLKEQEARLANHRIQLMISQIRPHFIFNALNTIYYLCKKDPSEAQRAIDDFSEYLRANLESLEKEKEVSFTREMECVRRYLNLEKMRFGDELKTEFDLRADHFSIPPMTVQPIVENAVKHGLMKKEGGGTVIIASRETEDSYEITVSDDGTGFSTEKNAPGRSEGHIGIRNVRERLERISGGELIIESEPGKGTRAVIRLPKKPRETNAAVLK